MVVNHLLLGSGLAGLPGRPLAGLLGTSLARLHGRSLGGLLGGDLLGLRRGILGDILDDGVYILRIRRGRIWIPRRG